MSLGLAMPRGYSGPGENALSFFFRWQAERHLVKHTGARPFPCPVCALHFSQRGSMLRHYDRVHKTIPLNQARRTHRRLPGEMAPIKPEGPEFPSTHELAISELSLRGKESAKPSVE
eukprot:m.684936 g.684936  ORF g.684936 m.684936 type:complete len:117 (+) comp58615_c1_seq20:30-380(+)